MTPMALNRREVPLLLKRHSSEATAIPDQETQALTASLTKAVRLNKVFEVDRPLLEAFNVTGGVPRLLKNLGGELEELFTTEFEGFWQESQTNPELKREYQRQELADIFVFSLAGLMRLGVEIESIPVAQVVKLAQTKSREYSRTPVTQRLPVDQKSPLTLDHFPALLTQLQFLRQQVQGLEELTQAEVKPEAKVYLFSLFHQLLIMCVTGYQLMGMDAGEAINEKIARNNIKYPAYLMRLPPGLTAEELLRTYREQATKCKQQFAMDEMWSPERPSQPKSEWQHLDKGSAAFYSIPRPADREVRPAEPEINSVMQWVVNALIAH